MLQENLWSDFRNIENIGTTDKYLLEKNLFKVRNSK